MMRPVSGKTFCTLPFFAGLSFCFLPSPEMTMTVSPVLTFILLICRVLPYSTSGASETIFI